MSTVEFGTLEDVPVRQGWPLEAASFTPWLSNNLDRLGKALGVPLSFISVEKPVGRYSADILAQDPNGRPVLIENQLEVSDHRHLGQVLTYLTGLKAEIIVWVAPDFRDEHLSAVHWLNENTKDPFAFFAVQLRLVRIGDSPMAPLFDVLARPNTWDRYLEEIAARANAPGPRAATYRAFWGRFRTTYPEAIGDASAGGGSSLWREVPRAGLVVSRWLAGDGVGVFVRGGRGVSMEAVTERLAPYEAELEARLGVGLTNTSFPLLVRRDFDMADQQTWPSAIAWLHETTEAYVQALSEILPAAPAATPD